MQVCVALYVDFCIYALAFKETYSPKKFKKFNVSVWSGLGLTLLLLLFPISFITCSMINKLKGRREEERQYR